MLTKTRALLSLIPVVSFMVVGFHAPVQAQEEANVNFDDEGDMLVFPPIDFPAFLDVLESRAQLTGGPGEETLVLRMMVAAPIDQSALPTGPGNDSAPPDGLQHPGVISHVHWRFALETDPEAFHGGFPYPPGLVVNMFEYFVDLLWDLNEFRAELWVSGVGPMEDVLEHSISEVDGRGVVEIRLPVSLIDGTSTLDSLHWTSGTLIGFGRPCTQGTCLKYIIDDNGPLFNFVRSE